MMEKIDRRKLTSIMKKIGKFAKENQDNKEKIDDYIWSIFPYSTGCFMDGLEDGDGCFLPKDLFDIEIKIPEVKKHINDSRLDYIISQGDFGIFIEYLNDGHVEIIADRDVTYRMKDGLVDTNSIIFKSIKI